MDGGKPVKFIDIRHEFPAPQFPVIPPERGMWRNGLVVRMPNHLGDAVMALPALEQLRRIVPEHCGMYVIAPAAQRALYHSLPIVDGMIGLSRLHSAWSRSELRKLRRAGMGVGVLFNNSLRDAFLMRLAGVANLYGAKARSRSFLLRRAFGFPPRPDREPANVHHANKYLAIAAALGAPPWDGRLPEFRLHTRVDELAPEITALCRHPKLLTVASGAAYGAAKRWPAENFRAVAEDWIAAGGVAAVLGSASEHAIGEEVVRGIDPRKIYNLCGKTGLAELMHLLHESKLTVANDSGIMHLSAAMGTPGVAVFGPTDFTATGPISPHWRLLYQQQDCSPCYRRECPRALRKCISVITPAMVIAEMHDMLDA